MLVLHFRADRLADMFAILAYAPILLCLPVLLVVGLVFVVIPGGFIVVLAGLYYGAAGFTSLFGLEVTRRLRAPRSRVRRADTGFEQASPSGQTSSGPRATTAPRPVAVGSTNDRAVASAPSVLLSRRGSDDVDLLAPLEHGPVPEGQDGARAA